MLGISGLLSQLRQADGRSVLAGAAGRATPRPGQREERNAPPLYQCFLHGIRCSNISRNMRPSSPKPKLLCGCLVACEGVSRYFGLYGCGPGRNLISVHLHVCGLSLGYLG